MGDVADRTIAPVVDISEQLLERRDARHIDQAMKAMRRLRLMLFALVRREGRVRISQREYQAIADADKLDVKVQENGDLVVSFEKGAT